MDRAIAMLNAHTPTHDQIMTGGPPLSAPIMRTPDNAVQLETIEKQNPIMLTRLNVRLSSILESEVAIELQFTYVQTLLVSKLLESDIICGRSIKHFLVYDI
jgi:hypothetical protein